MTRFLVTGASGLLGLNFALQVSEQHEVYGVVNHHALDGVPFTVLQADLAQPGEVERLLEASRPEVVLHCAAMANVDACETQPELAYRLNAELPGELAAATARRGLRLVHVSTDAVFDGTKGDYSEDDLPNPLSQYARTKWQGEQAVQAANPQAWIARVNFYGWSLGGGRSLAEFFFNNLSMGKGVKGFTDVYFCPFLVNDLVDVLLAMLAKAPGGLYHVVSPECISKYEFGRLVAHQFGLDESLIAPVSWVEGGLRAARSPNLTLRNDRLRQALQMPLPGQAEGMARLYRLYQEGWPQRLRAFAAA
jgi:dTDP-4-dehydrorhamnose reductase